MNKFFRIISIIFIVVAILAIPLGILTAIMFFCNGEIAEGFGHLFSLFLWIGLLTFACLAFAPVPNETEDNPDGK